MRVASTYTIYRGRSSGNDGMVWNVNGGTCIRNIGKVHLLMDSEGQYNMTYVW